MTHYDGNRVPVFTVTMPESVPEEQREPDWTPERISRGIVLCCEDDGFLYASLFDDETPDIDWNRLFRCVYNTLTNSNNPGHDQWLKEFETALNAGVPAEARALRARLLKEGFSENTPCDTGVYHNIRMRTWAKDRVTVTDLEFRRVYPKGDTIAFETDDCTETEVRNTREKKGMSGNEFDCHELLALHTNDDDIIRERLRKRISLFLDGTDEHCPISCYPGQRNLPEDLLAKREDLRNAFVTGAFQIPGEGTIYVNFYGVEEPVDFDDLPTDLLDNLANELSNRSDLAREISCMLKKDNAVTTTDGVNEYALEPEVILGDDEACGLSELEKPHAISAWLDADGKVAVRVEGYDDFVPERVLSTNDLLTLRKGIFDADKRQIITSALHDFVKKAGGKISCDFTFQEFIFSYSEYGTSHIKEILIQEDDTLVLLREAYDEQSLDSLNDYTLEFLENIYSHIINTENH